MKRIFISILTVVFIAALSFSINLSANATTSTIIGEVTSVGDGMLAVKEDNTQREYELKASAAKLAVIQTGYRVEVRSANGRVSSLTVLGMPMQAEPMPDQIWKVIRPAE